MQQPRKVINEIQKGLEGLEMLAQRAGHCLGGGSDSPNNRPGQEHSRIAAPGVMALENAGNGCFSENN